MTADAARAEDVDRAVACMRTHAHARALGGLAYDVLSAQAEGRSLFSGQQVMAQRAQKHGVDHALAVTDLGNLLSVLERGPSNRIELALVAAFAARGLEDALASASAEERTSRMQKLVTHLDYLELSTPYRWTPCLERVLSAPHKQALYEALADAVLQDDASVDVEADVGRSARIAARVSVLGAAPEAGAARARVVASAKHVFTRAMCSVFGESGPAQAPLHVTGHAAPVTRRPGPAVLRWLTGIALLQWVVRVLAYLVRVQRRIDVTLEGRALRIRRQTSWLGRTLRSVEAVYDVERVSGAFRRARYALLRTLTGMLALALGVLLGSQLALDGAAGGAPLLLMVAAAVIALGSGLDLALDVLGPALRGQVHLQIDLRDAGSVKLSGVSLGEADAFLERLQAVLSARG